ncbi:MAG: hypothetical protein MRERV_15c034 [Mycoplasmataceae bacterium RV_VA103A]|nr:MAG: hypothetical protein MRERV_15c034 [Mycoplasmataceae bacterium RV_VA103A]
MLLWIVIFCWYLQTTIYFFRLTFGDLKIGDFLLAATK